jgi:hypothetical protein
MSCVECHETNMWLDDRVLHQLIYDVAPLTGAHSQAAITEDQASELMLAFDCIALLSNVSG